MWEEQGTNYIIFSTTGLEGGKGGKKNSADVPLQLLLLKNARLLQRIATRGNTPHREAAQGTTQSTRINLLEMAQKA